MLNKYKQNKILPSLSALALINTAAFSGIVAGQSQATVEEVVVTARKKAESLQDVPVSVSALREETLEENVAEEEVVQARAPKNRNSIFEQWTDKFKELLDKA